MTTNSNKAPLFDKGALPKLTKPQAALYERVKAGGLLMRELSAAENRMAHRLKDMGLLALDGSISSRGPYNKSAQNDQTWVLYEDMHPDHAPATVSNCRCDGSGVLMDKIGDGGRPGRCPCVGWMFSTCKRA